MLYKNVVTFSYEKLQFNGRKLPKRMLEAAILKNGRHLGFSDGYNFFLN